MIHYPKTYRLLNKRSELIAKYCHANKYLPCNYKSNNRNRYKELLAAPQTHSWRLVSVKIMSSIKGITKMCQLHSFPSSFLMKKFSVNSISADFRVMHLKSRGDDCLRGTTSSVHCTEELVFWAKPWGVILTNLSNNETSQVFFCMFTGCSRFV